MRFLHVKVLVNIEYLPVMLKFNSKPLTSFLLDVATGHDNISLASLVVIVDKYLDLVCACNKAIKDHKDKFCMNLRATRRCKKKIFFHVIKCCRCCCCVASKMQYDSIVCRILNSAIYNRNVHFADDY